MKPNWAFPIGSQLTHTHGSCFSTHVRCLFVIYSWSVKMTWPHTSDKHEEWGRPLNCSFSHGKEWVLAWVSCTKYALINLQTLVCGMCACARLCWTHTHFLSATQTAAVPDSVSVLRLFRGLGLRGVQIPAACFLGEKGFLWYAPDQRGDARDPGPQRNHWSDCSFQCRALIRKAYRLSKANVIHYQDSTVL